MVRTKFTHLNQCNVCYHSCPDVYGVASLAAAQERKDFIPHLIQTVQEIVHTSTKQEFLEKNNNSYVCLNYGKTFNGLMSCITLL